jgi:hypothetical protein
MEVLDEAPLGLSLRLFRRERAIEVTILAVVFLLAGGRAPRCASDTSLGIGSWPQPITPTSSAPKLGHS